MANIQLNDEQVAVLEQLDPDLDLSLRDGLFTTPEGPLPTPVPGTPGYAELATSSQSSIRAAFRQFLGTFLYSLTKSRREYSITDMSGSPGDCEINASKGRFALDPGTTEITITNNQVTTNSVVVIVPEDDQSPISIGFWYVTPANGSFTFHWDGGGYVGVHRFVVY